LYEKAGDQGNALAQYDLGVMYADGRGVRQDYATAATWFRKSADRGVTKAQYNLAVQYAKGQGVPTNPVQAYKWLSIAVLSAETPDVRNVAARTRDGIAGHMTKTQIAEADKQVKTWKALPAGDDNFH
jgi:TPR repeat protein